jgi:ribosomal protein S18 acetylase RimI-like enzyme
MNPDVPAVCRLLEQDPLRNLATLKMLNSYPNSMSFELQQGADGWALLGLLDVRDSEWDRKTYPACKYVAFINGNSPRRKLQLLARLPKENLVLKVADEAVRQRIVQTGNGTKVMTFHSFTAGTHSSLGESDPKLPRSSAYNPGAWAMFRSNGYEHDELARYFHNGAQWFGIQTEGQLASACFLFQNYKQIWEIAGVYTHPDFRRRGFAKKIVCGALNYLAASGLVPRYQARGDNHPSISLAKACGLTQFLQMDHYLLTLPSIKK